MSAKKTSAKSRAKKTKSKHKVVRKEKKSKSKVKKKVKGEVFKPDVKKELELSKEPEIQKDPLLAAEEASADLVINTEQKEEKETEVVNKTKVRKDEGTEDQDLGTKDKEEAEVSEDELGVHKEREELKVQNEPEVRKPVKDELVIEEIEEKEKESPKEVKEKKDKKEPKKKSGGKAKTPFIIAGIIIAVLAVIALVGYFFGTCKVSGKKYFLGASWQEDCNTCSCDIGGKTCTEIACKAEVDGCTYAGMEYEYNDTFDDTDGCNVCICTQNGVKCTDIECNENEALVEDVPNEFNKVGFLKLKDYDVETDNELWMLDLGTLKTKDTGLTGYADIFSSPNGRWDVLVKDGVEDANKFYIYDKYLDEVSDFEMENPDDANLEMNHAGILPFSPDGSVYIFSVDYFEKVCLDICDTVDLYPDFMKGYYAYHFKDGDLVYLGDFLIPSSWSADSNYVYITEGEDYYAYKLADNVFKIDVNDGDSKLALNLAGRDYFSQNYVYSSAINSFAFSRGDIDSNMTQNGIVGVASDTVLDSGDWAEIQPHMFLNPSQEKLLYFRSVAAGPNMLQKVMLMDLDAMTFSELLVEGEKETLHSPMWISDTEFVIKRETWTSESWDPSESVKDLYLYDLESEEFTNLTESGDVK